MDLFSDMVQGVQDDLTLGAESSFISPEIIKRAINRAKRKVEGLFRWPETEDAKTLTLTGDADYLDFPQLWRPDSAWKLKVNDQDYGKPLTFKSFQSEQDNDWPSGREVAWTKQWKRYFAYPAFLTGDVVTLWGLTNLEDLVEDEDTTIFSYSMPEVNEAIVLEAAKILKSKEEEQNSGEMLSAEAKGIVVVAWSRIKQDSTTEEELAPMLDVPDFFAPTSSTRKDSNTGRF
jgi:hypothetical protein